jgi:hypothetical protein
MIIIQPPLVLLLVVQFHLMNAAAAASCLGVFVLLKLALSFGRPDYNGCGVDAYSILDA